jgi:formiminoglutamase
MFGAWHESTHSNRSLSFWVGLAEIANEYQYFLMLKSFKMPEDLLKTRTDDPSLKKWAHLTATPTFKNLETVRGDVALLAYPDDRGVKNNYGRVGARLAPSVFRKVFYKMSALKLCTLVDVGDMQMKEKSLNHSQEKALSLLLNLRKQFPLVVTVGGGHDWAAVDFDISEAQIIHIDTHLDVRPFEKKNVHSGMPFRYLAEKGARIWCLGAQPEYNSPEHWKYAQTHFEALWSLDEVQKDFTAILTNLLCEIEKNKPLCVSLDMDVFSQSVSPGVSAPSPRGMSVESVVEVLEAVAKDIRHLGIYELNPKLDRDLQSHRLASYFLSRLLSKRF